MQRPVLAFVDDEKNVIDGLRRLLRGYRKEWDMRFYTSADEALADMEGSHFDVVVSDMRMPGINGGQFLKAVQAQSPDTFRIALSGYADSELTLASIHAIHQFINKPASADTIAKALQRALFTCSWLSNQTLKDELGAIENLPALPSVYNELMADIQSENSTANSLAVIIERDLALTTEILRIVSSSFFGLVTHVASTSHAVSLLGPEVIKNIALVSSVIKSLPCDDRNIDRLANISTRAHSSGVLAKKLIRALDATVKDQDHAHLAAMLSQLGELVLLQYRNPPSNDVDTPLVGAYLLSVWNLPFAIIEAVRWHQNPGISEFKADTVLATVHAAWAFHQCMEDHGRICPDYPLLDTEYIQSSFGSEVLETWLAEANDFFTSEG